MARPPPPVLAPDPTLAPEQAPTVAVPLSSGRGTSAGTGAPTRTVEASSLGSWQSQRRAVGPAQASLTRPGSRVSAEPGTRSVAASTDATRSVRSAPAGEEDEAQ